MRQDHNYEDQPQDDDRKRMEPRTDRYAALPDKTRIFIENLHDDDLNNLDGLLKLVREKKLSRIVWMVEVAEAAGLLGRYSKWLAVFAVAIFGGITTLMTSWSAFKGYFSGGHP